jgi:hypothetical protein
MTKVPMLRKALLAVMAFAAAPRPVGAQEGLTIPGLKYRFDLRPAIDHPDRLGLDFDVAYHKSRGNDLDPRGVVFGLNLEAKGFQTFSDVPDVNSMVGEVSLLGHYYRQSDAKDPLPPELVVRYLELSDVEPENLTGGQQGELSRIQGRILGKRTLFRFDFHYRYETDHDLGDDDHALGIGVSGELPGLNQTLDAIPSLTRPKTSLQSPLLRQQPVRAFVGLDHVMGAEDTRVGQLTGKSSLWRARGELAWGTRALQGFALRATFEVHYLFDANAALKDADREWDTFLQAWLSYPLSDKMSVIAKYIGGRLPPDYDSSKSGKVGFSIALQ